MFKRALVQMFYFGLLHSQLGMGIINLEAFLAEVKTKHLGYQGHVLGQEGASLRENEATLLTAPNLFLNLQYQDDQKERNNPAFEGDRLLYQGYSLGVSKQTRFGLGAKLSYVVNHVDLRGASPAFVPTPKYYTTSPVLELSQSLWKNGFGSETRAQIYLASRAAKASALMEGFKAKALLAEAEGTYWGMVVAREIVRVQKEGVERQKKIRDWSKRRASLQLADQGDALQAEAGLQGRELELQMSLDEEKSAARSFNSLLGKSEDSISDELQRLDGSQLEKLEIPAKKDVKREDVLAAEALRDVALANTALGRDKNSPSLDLMGSLALNGRDVAFGESASESSKTQRPTYAVGVKFSTPLDLGQISSDREAYLKEEKAAELNYQRKLFESEEDWNDLNRKFLEAKRRLGMAINIEKVQLQKLENEKKRLKIGRSVLYQVLSFEQDYANSQILRLKTEFEILKLHALMKTYP